MNNLIRKNVKLVFIFTAILFFTSQFIETDGKNSLTYSPPQGGNYTEEEQETTTVIGEDTVYQKIVVICIEPGSNSCSPSCKERYNPSTSWIDCSAPQSQNILQIFNAHE